MVSQKVPFPLPWREGTKGRGIYLVEIPFLFTLTPTLSLPR